MATDDERGGGAAGGAGGAAVESARVAMVYAARRMGFIGENIPGDVNVGKLIEKLAETIKNGQTPTSDLIKKAGEALRKASTTADKQSAEKAKQSRALVVATVKRVQGLDLDDDAKHKVADKLQSELVDQNLQDLLDKPAKDLTDTEVELIKTTVLKEVIENELTDDQLETLFNAANDRVKEELGDTQDIDGNRIADQLPDKIEKGSADFKNMKESFKDDAAKFIIKSRNLEGGAKGNVIPSGASQAEMASRALFRNRSYFSGDVPTISQSDFTGNMTGATDLSSGADFSAINFGDGATKGQSLGAGADQGATILRSAEIKPAQGKLADTIKSAADKALTNRKIDAGEEAVKKAENKEEAAEKKEAAEDKEEKTHGM